MARRNKNSLGALGDKEDHESNEGRLLTTAQFRKSQRGHARRHEGGRYGGATFGGSGGARYGYCEEYVHLRNHTHEQRNVNTGRGFVFGRGRGRGRGMDLNNYNGGQNEREASGVDKMKISRYENKDSGGQKSIHVTQGCKITDDQYRKNRKGHFGHGSVGTNNVGKHVRSRDEHQRSHKGKNVVSDHIIGCDVASVKVSKDEGKKTFKVVKGYNGFFKGKAEQWKYVRKKLEEDEKDTTPMKRQPREVVVDADFGSMRLVEKQSEDSIFEQVELSGPNVKGTSETGARETENTSEDMFDLGICHEHCAPMINVCSFTIHSNSFKPCKIYGNIYSKDVKDDVYDLYEREQNDAEKISANGTLLLNNLSGCVMTMDAVMFIELKDKDDDDDDAWFAHGRLNLETMTESNNAEVKSQTFHGNRGDVVVEYIAMPFADFVIVEVELTGHDVGNEDVGIVVDGSVHGDIVAYYINPFGGREIILFRKRVESQRMTLVPTSTFCEFQVCVPANCQLGIKVDLKFGIAGETTVIYGSEAFDPHGSDHKRDISKGNICIRVNANRYPPIGFYGFKMFDTTLDRGTAESHTGLVTMSHKQRMLRSTSLDLFGGEQLALFSVYIGHNSDNPLAFFGTVKVKHYLGRGAYGRRSIFVRDRTRPFVLDQSLKSLPLEDRLSFRIAGFTLWMDLKDVEGHEFIRGVLGHNHVFVPDHMYDIPLCALIKGRKGYAAVHYVVFSRAVSATVEVFLVFKGSATTVDTNVYGKLVANFGKYKYANSYQARFYEIVLLDKPEIEKEHLLTGYCSDLPEAFALSLCRSSVTVPAGDDLVIEVDLNVSAEGCPSENLTGDRTFRIGSDGESEVIDGEHFQVRFSLEWIDLAR